MKEKWGKKVVGILVLAVVVVVMIAVVVTRKAAQKDDSTEEKVYPVTVMEAGETGSDVYLTYTGLVQPSELTQCTFETIGTVKTVYVKKGDAVKEGDLLVSIDDSEAQDRLESANRQLDYAVKNQERAQDSYDDAQEDYATACSASEEKEDLDDAIARRDTQQAKVDDLKAQLDATSQYKTTDSSDASDGSGEASGDSGSGSTGLGNGSTGSGLSGTGNVTGVTNSYTMPEVNTDYYTLQMQYESAMDTLELYQQNVDAAQEAYDKKLKEGADSNDAKAQKERLDAAEETLDNMNEAVDNARDSVEEAQDAVDKCTLKARADGYVVDIEVSEGSVSTPIVPAVVLASNDVVVNFGVSQGDITTLSAGMPVSITIEGQEFVGSIKDIDIMPDESTRTYSTNVTIDVADPDVYLGELATVRIGIGERRGIWLPIAVVLNDGNDYVYVAEDGRAKRKYISIEEVSDDMVLVSGTDAGDLIITEGMKLIRTGSAVSYEQ
jgi:RND family efflux transporter MFP subunit